MSVSAEPNSAAARRAASAALVAHFEASGYPRFEPPILQRAELFFNSGEDIRSRLYLTSDLSGAEYCPAARIYDPRLSPIISPPKRWGTRRPTAIAAPYSGIGRMGRTSFLQAGLENFGHPDREAADAEILGVALDAVGRPSAKAISMCGSATMGWSAISSPRSTCRRNGSAVFCAAMRRINRSIRFSRVPGNGKGADHTGVLAALEGVDRHGARALVEDLLSIAGISSVGGRSVTEIADTLSRTGGTQNRRGIPRRAARDPERILAIETDPDQAAARLRQLAATTSLNLNAALDRFDARLGFMAARGLDVTDFTFATRFARDLEYYTGFVFEAFDRSRPQEKADRRRRPLRRAFEIAWLSGRCRRCRAAISIERLLLPQRGQTDWWR